jgi:hypothetical protein
VDAGRKRLFTTSVTGARDIPQARALPRGFFHPVWWLALVVLLVNDHVLKGSGLLPGGVTGKLSDVAGLVVLPPLLAWALGAGRRHTGTVAVGASAGLLAAVNVWPEAGRAVEQVASLLGVRSRIWVDPADLWTLPAALVAWPLCAPRPGARRAPSRVVARLAVGVASLACVATTDDSGGGSAQRGDAPTLINDGDEPFTVIIASTEGAGGCRLYRDDRVAALTVDAFTARREAVLEEGDRIALVADSATSDCGAAWVLLPDGDELLVWWRDLDRLEDFVPDDDPQRLDRQIRVEGRAGRFASDIGDDLRRFELGDEPSESNCAEDDVEHSLEFSLPAALQGFYRVEEAVEDSDGCLEVTWSPDEGATAGDAALDMQRLCVPRWAFPFADGESVSVVAELGEYGARTLRITRFDEGLRDVQLAIYNDWAELPEGAVQALEADDCYGTVTECGAYVRPLLVDVRREDEALRSGDEAEIGGEEPRDTRLLLGPGRDVAWTGAECEGPEARVGSSLSFLELRAY